MPYDYMILAKIREFCSEAILKSYIGIEGFACSFHSITKHVSLTKPLG
jgi:hypothetical protein